MISQIHDIYLGKTVNEQTNNYLIIFIFSKCINN
jgi:hypothetical protein